METRTTSPTHRPGALAAFTRGLAEATRHLPLAGVMWLVNLLAALPLAVFFRAAVGSSFEGSSLGPYLLLDDVTRKNAAVLEALGEAAGVTGLVYMAVGALVAAGAVESLAVTPRGFRFSTFFGGIARSGGRYVRLFLVVIAVAFCVLWVMNGPVAWLVERTVGEAANEWPVLIATALRYGLTILLLFGVLLVADYARVLITLDGAASALGAVSLALQYVVARPAAVGAFVLCEGVSLLTFGFVWALQQAPEPAGWAGLLALVVAQQAIMVARMWTRLVFWATEIEVVRGVAA